MFRNLFSRSVANVALLMVAFGFARTAVFVQLIATPLTAKSMTIQGGASSILNTIPLAFLYYGATFVALPASLLMKSLGRQKGFIIGCFFGMIGAGVNTLAVFSQYKNSPFPLYFLLLCIGSLFLGFANGFAQFFRYAAADAAPQRRSFAISAVLLGGDAAALIGPSLGTWTQNAFPWTFGATYLSVIGLFIGTIFTLLFVQIPKQEVNNEDHPPPRPLLQLFLIPRFTTALISATIGFSMMVLLMVLIPLVMDDLKFSFSDIGHILQIHSIGMFAPGLFVGFLIEKCGTIVVIIVGFIIMCGSTIVLFVNVEYWNFLVGMLFLGIGWNLVFVSGTTMLTLTYTPAEKAKAQGINDIILFFIVSTFSLTSGGLWHLLGSWAAVNMFALAFCICGLIAILINVVYERFKAIPVESEPLLVNETEENEEHDA